MNVSVIKRGEAARRKPHAFHLRGSVIVHCPAAKVFAFIIKELPRYYAKLAKGHEKFEIIGADELTEGAVVDCRETAGSQVVHHQYKVERVERDRLVHYASRPTRVFVRTPGRTVEMHSDTYVYYDLEPMGTDATRLSLTIVIQISGFFLKLLGTVTGTRGLWAGHLAEELGALKDEIER